MQRVLIIERIKLNCDAAFKKNFIYILEKRKHSELLDYAAPLHQTCAPALSTNGDQVTQNIHPIDEYGIIYFAGLLDKLHDCDDKHEIVSGRIKNSVTKLHNKKQMSAFRERAHKI